MENQNTSDAVDVATNLHCVVTHCKEKVTGHIHQNDLQPQDIVEAHVLDCENESIRHYSNGLLVKLVR